MKLQWSIQPRHTQLALDHVIHLNYRNMYIWPPTKLDNISWNFKNLICCSTNFIDIMLMISLLRKQVALSNVDLSKELALYHNIFWLVFVRNVRFSKELILLCLLLDCNVIIFLTRCLIVQVILCIVCWKRMLDYSCKFLVKRKI